jgi:hypothetical protein
MVEVVREVAAMGGHGGMVVRAGRGEGGRTMVKEEEVQRRRGCGAGRRWAAEVGRTERTAVVRGAGVGAAACRKESGSGGRGGGRG